MEPDELSLEDEIGLLATRLDGADAALANGREIDLSGLDRQTEALCRRIAATDPVPSHLLPSLQVLVDRLSGLEDDLKRRKAG